VERIREVLIDVFVGINYLVKSRIHFHNWVMFILGEVFDLADCFKVCPVLRIILQIPCIIVFDVQRWLINQVGDSHFALNSGLAILALICSYIIGKQFLDLRSFRHRC